MAVAKLVCSECGGGVSPGDAFCSTCGARLGDQRVDGGAGPRSFEQVGQGGVRRCEVCGFENAGEGLTCESCGARLPDSRVPASAEGISSPPAVPEHSRTPASTAPALKAAEASRKSGKGPKQKSAVKQRRGSAGGRSRFEPWQIISGIAVLALAGLFIYTEAVNVKPKSRVPAPENLTSQQPPSAESIAPLQQAADANPSDASALLHLANALQDNNLLPRAIEAYKKYLLLVPGDPNARVDLGICYYQRALADSANSRELFTLATKEMTTAFGSSPTHQPAAYNLGIVYLHLGNLDEADTWFKKALELDKDSDLGKKAAMMLEKHGLQQ